MELYEFGGDVFITVEKRISKFVSSCGCKDRTHRAHKGRGCGTSVERNTVPSKGHFTCHSCRAETKKEQARLARLAAKSVHSAKTEDLVDN